jgi:3-phosphoshikimate 1-carboxyvinyltransferase
LKSYGEAVNVPKESLNKLSGRIKLIVSELAKMGVKISHSEEQVVFEGGKPLKGTVVESYNDERIAMSLAVAGCIADNETVIRRAQCVDVVYPEFFDVLNKL